MRLVKLCSRRKLRQVVNKETGGDMVRFNNKIGRTKDEVVAVLRHAAYQ